MAILKNNNTGEQIFLRSFHTFGRNRNKADCVLENPDASQLHASIRWDGENWNLIDHSKNGTLLDNLRIPSNIGTILKAGQKIQFALGAHSSWLVQNLDAPCAMLLSLRRGTPDIKLQNFNLLPDEITPLASVYLSDNGLWYYECDGVSVILQDGDMVHAGLDIWRFTCSPEIESTADIHHQVRTPGQRIGEDILLDFKVSLNEEHIALCVINPTGAIDLGERTHHYTLLTLARRRLADSARGLDLTSQGWIDIDELSIMLGVEQNHLNMQIYRARNQLSKALPGMCDLINVIERRRRELRFGAFQFQIMRGTAVEGKFKPERTIS